MTYSLKLNKTALKLSIEKAAHMKGTMSVSLEDLIVAAVEKYVGETTFPLIKGHIAKKTDLIRLDVSEVTEISITTGKKDEETKTVFLRNLEIKAPENDAEA